MRRLTTEWVEKAETDVRSAKKLAADSEPLHEAVYFRSFARGPIRPDQQMRFMVDGRHSI